MTNIFDYKWWWSKIGGRPWTYIIRDIWHNLEYFMQAFWFFLGVTVAVKVINFFSPYEFDISLSFVLKVCVFLWLIYTFGYINGHFFWGKKYIPSQKGD